ncbi:unnamed protein product, partial [Anisakis simplex]|uniref:Tfpi2 protein (inferred by orthology to a zebrafish protein) n=1 Tax=Anisakis simplex TaxID=6269 RepID=A0A0M3K4Q4_ANISI
MSFFLLFSSWLLVVLKPGHAQEMLANAKCNDYPDRGTCEDRGFTVKWYYDRFSHRCREFYYGGCGGNNNRFDSFEDCTNECHFEVGIDMIADIRCHLPHDPGNCWGDFQRWSFDSNLKKCVCSTWSGCGGNANRFYSYEHCMSICGRFTNRDASNTSPSPEQLRTAHNIFSEMNKQRRRFFTAAPVQVIPISYRNLFVNGNGNQTYESGRTIFTGLPPAAIYTRILPSSSTRRVWHIRGDAQVLPNGTLSTKELFRIQQVLRNNQLRSQNENAVPHYRSPRTKATNKRVSADRMTSSPSSSAAVLSSSSQTSNDGSLTDQQRAHLEQRKWRHYTQEQARIREENYRRQLEAIRNRQEALNLYRYNQQYPVRGRSHTPLSSTSSGSSRPQNQPSQERNIDTPTKQKYSSSVQLLLRTQPYQEDNRTPKLRARYESPIPSDDRESGRNVLDSEVARHSNMQTESIGKSEQHFRQTQSTDITNETPRRAEPQANQERPQGTAQVMGSNSALHSTSYDDRQLEYYRQLQEHRRRYLEQIRERQLREREAELRRREYLIRTQSMSEKARALALERLKQQRQIELQSSAASSASASSSLPSSQFAVDKQQSHSESHINTLSHHPKAQSIQASHQQPKPLSQQEQFQPQRETSTSNHLGRQQSAYGKNIGSWLDSDSQRSYLKQHIHVHQPLPTTTPPPPPTTTTTTTTTAIPTTTKMSTPM